MSDSFREGEAYRAGAAGRGLTGGTQQEYDAWQQGQQATRDKGISFAAPPAGPGAGLGVMLLIPALILAPLALLIGACLYPAAGIMTAIVTGMIAGILDDGHTGGLMMTMAALLPGIFVFVFGLKVERRLSEYRFYLRLRHGLRVLGIAFLAHVVAMTIFRTGHGPTSIVTYLTHGAIVVAGAYGGHLLAKRMDVGSLAPRTWSDKFTPRWLRSRTSPE